MNARLQMRTTRIFAAANDHPPPLRDNKMSIFKALSGKKVIIRTHHAGVWFGTLTHKKRDEVIIADAVAVFGIIPEKSKICAPVPQVWLQAIEILPASFTAIKSIEDAPIVVAE